MPSLPNIPILFLLILTLLACKQNDVVINFINSGDTLIIRIATPSGYSRETYSQGTWEYYLQHLELKAHNSKILDYKGNPISNQSSHIAIINYDIGTKDLQQCADAVIRLRAEHLFANGKSDEIQFEFTSGDNFKWLDYAKGMRPVVNGNSVSFRQSGASDKSYASFRKYLDVIYMYAGTISLSHQLNKKSRSNALPIGDIILNPGSPGHAVIVIDRAFNSSKEYIYLLAEGYTPAQSIHVLDSKNNSTSPWFKIPKTGTINTGRYKFNDPNIVTFK
ncbi:MAG: hypothetical protein IPG60_14785 [Bacteroidetes bacterium]|nr:hypothetical protein [Bacteroidota bacterium]